MKERTIIILRHAKSSWGDAECSDFDRKLNKRGLRDAPFMAQILKKHLPHTLDLIVTSPAKRARLTTQYFQKEFGLNDDSYWEDKRLYHAYLDTITEVIQECPNEVDHILIGGHNPGLTYFVNEFPGFSLDNLPTAGIVVAKIKIESWKDFNPGMGKVVAFHYPKQYFS